MSVLAAKRKEFQAKTAEAVALRDTIAANTAANEPTETEQKAFDALMDGIFPALDAEIKRLAKLEDAETVAGEMGDEGKAGARKTVDSPARVHERAFDAPTIGEQLAHFLEGHKSKFASGIPNGLNMPFEAKGTLRGTERKATFGSGPTGLDTTVQYISRPVEELGRQRLYVRDLLAVGQTTQAAVKFIRENSFTNAADMVGEEGEKPEATFDTSTTTANVHKIAAVAKVTDEMWSDFPMLRDYVNTTMYFMVENKEEQQLLNGAGTGNEIQGILNVSGIQTQAKGGDTNLDAIHKAMTKIRVATGTAGGYEPDGIVMHPTDYQLIRLAKDGQNQYYGGGPFYGAYGNGGFVDQPGPWGLKCVVTTAITAGTALIGAFKSKAQIWQRDGIRVDSTNTNEDDFNFNRISLRVEERLALAVYAPSAFCTVTSIA